MDENQYQLGIRKLSQSDLVKLVIAYRNQLKECMAMNVAFYKRDFGKDPLHKITCVMANTKIQKITEDYTHALEENK